MKTEVICISPEMAKTILQKNSHNRKVRKRYVTTLANAMKRGEWLLTHQGIAVSDKGRLIDGQHRLLAIIESGVKVEMAMFTKVPDESFKVLDRGAKRSLADATGLAKNVAETLRVACSIASGDGHVTPQQVEEMYIDIGHIPEQLVQYCGQKVRYFSTAGGKLAAVLAIMDGAQQERVFASYMRLVHQRYEEMTTAEMAISRQVAKGAVSSAGMTGTKDLITRLFAVYTRPNSKRIQVTEQQQANVIQRARELLNGE